MNFQPRHWLAVSVLLGTIGLTAGCASDPAGAHIKFIELVNKDLTTAYLPAHNEVSSWDDTWQIGRQSVNVAWLAPVNHERLPLIIYLPGLGESATAGEQWRTAWAQAGYAVLSVQGQAYGPALYLTGQAQAGVFRELAADRYSNASLRDRLSTLQKVLSEVRARAAKGEAQLASIDWSQVAVAGFDLGAQTAAAVAGAGQVDVATGIDIEPKAVLLISPFAEIQAKPEVFARIASPVLTITSQDDEDPFNWVSSNQQRELVGASVTAAGSHRLRLSRATYKTLSGSDLVPIPTEGKELKVSEDDHTPGGKSHAKTKLLRSGAHSPVGAEPVPDPKQVASIQAVSQAFLDSRVKHNPAASDWLQKTAPGWLGTAGWLQ
ncbi:alpha/beta hydrolase [Pseudomonas sp. CCC3.2]|uniref:alpha/beta hydrolase n=1 Tax=unclassified Pseudomonas TaxID=196821 RepID=UPI002AB48E03|nr:MULTISPECIES: alpha/beta hydrolase [unclassified Pseudomonas]MDY7563276.1 alpha/beta hydrolase [Pseudomonas sp. AB6]MEA9979206.1 alpha/beta hydrolase [Pseudomonas sp. RTS4]MEB0181691.1 alpha/beta hydrolase [Pseudomonas sp. CCC3.2]MEB0199576.1 alpha/beta hydrolase [Pseudomonas sp. 5S4]MEB0211547.1 alpha/beta hydrolase [Pseudomonas sp. AB6]